MTPSVLYITRNGILEPLGQSQVMAYLRGLSRDYRITLISFEKPEDIADQKAMARIRTDCEAYNIRWLPQRFHFRPRIIAPAWSMLVFFWLCLREVRCGNADLIHARSYIPAVVALWVYRLTGMPFIFDMRALWPEELITARGLKRGSFLHRLIVDAERKCLKHSAAVVSLTEAAVSHLKEIYPAELKGRCIAVIPTCADLDRFVPVQRPDGQKIYGCIGTVLSGWFRIHWLAAFFKAAAKHDATVQFEIVTRDDPDRVKAALQVSGETARRLTIYAREPQDVHEVVQSHSVSIMFFTEGLSKLGSSPTRMAEVLGCGIPVVANDGVGDVAGIIKRYNVGVLVKNNDQASMNQTYSELQELLQDTELPGRCRRAAEEVFSLENGTNAYRQLYERILNRKDTLDAEHPEESSSCSTVN